MNFSKILLIFLKYYVKPIFYLVMSIIYQQSTGSYKNLLYRLRNIFRCLNPENEPDDLTTKTNYDAKPL